MHRFTRTRLLLGNKSFQRLLNSHVAVIGLGAVGGYAAEGLARAGVGSLTLVDFDTIHLSNINRQLLALESSIGQPKVAAMHHRLLEINPDCRVYPMELFADQDSIEQILSNRPDVVVDAIDSLNPKFQVLAASHRHGIKTFSSMGAALRTDPSQIRTADLANTKNCPLARRLRKRLSRHGITSGITCVYSTERVDFDYQPPATEATAQQGSVERGRARATLGSLPTLTGIFGLILANEVIFHLCGIDR